MLVLVTGMQREAKIVGRGNDVIVSGGDNDGLERKIEAAVARGASAILSIGIGGGLAPDLPVGAVIVANEIIWNETRLQTDEKWRSELGKHLTGVMTGAIAGSDKIVAYAGAKAALHRETGAMLVDMESHVAAKVAAERNLPFAALRVVSDNAKQNLPPAVFGAVGRDGELNLGAVLRSIAANPAQIPALIRAARDSNRAMASLLRCFNLLGAGFACPYLG
jgi:adenosylhomocysteine nucleosidase